MVVAICDDCKDNILRFTDVLCNICEKFRIELNIEPYTSGNQMLFELDDMKDQPDVIYLDIDMPGIDGIETARRLRERDCESEIIFLTASSMKDMILRAFDVDAFHFLIKEETPIERFEEIFLKAFDKCRKKARETLVFSCAGENRKVFVEDIVYFEARDHYITVYYGNKNFEFYSTFGKIENILLDKGFVRIHRSYIVAAGKIIRLSKDGLQMKGGPELPVGRSYLKSVRTAFKSRKTI